MSQDLGPRCVRGNTLSVAAFPAAPPIASPHAQPGHTGPFTHRRVYSYSLLIVSYTYAYSFSHSLPQLFSSTYCLFHLGSLLTHSFLC